MAGTPRDQGSAVALSRRPPSRRAPDDGVVDGRGAGDRAGSTSSGEVQGEHRARRAGTHPGGDQGGHRATCGVALAAGQRSASVQLPRAGTRARHTSRPWAITVTCSDPRSSLGTAVSKARPVHRREFRCAARARQGIGLDPLLRPAGMGEPPAGLPAVAGQAVVMEAERQAAASISKSASVSGFEGIASCEVSKFTRGGG